MTEHGDELPVDATIDADPTELDRLLSESPTGEPTPEPDEARSTAREFVAEARRRTEEQATTEAGASTAPARRGRSVLVIGLALVVAAQIIAAGAYVTLRSLEDDEPTIEDEVAVSEDLTAPLLDPEVDDGPAPDATPTLTPTATPVPPTPEWIPATNGPRQAPFNFVVTPAIDAPAFLSEPDGAPVGAVIDGEPFTGTLSSGAPAHLRVVSGDPEREWVQVALPDDDASFAWVRSAEFVWSASYRLVQVDVSANRLRVFEGNDVLLEVNIASGVRSDPTPRQQTWVVENPFADGSSELAQLLTARTEGQPRLIIDVADDESVLGTYSTDGGVLLGESDARTVARAVVPGAKVEVIGVPAAPTPTPLPTPTPRPVPTSVSGSVGTGGGGCPRGTQGSAPDCYRVVRRLEVLGECPGLQIVIEDRCMSFAGDIERFDGREQCPAQASYRIGDRCYTPQGSIPIEEGDCPPGSVEVGAECRQAVVVSARN